MNRFKVMDRLGNKRIVSADKFIVKKHSVVFVDEKGFAVDVFFTPTYVTVQED